MQQFPIKPPDVVLGTYKPGVPIVDHYAGNVRFIRKALALFGDEAQVDITVDLEDGASVGNESIRARELSKLVAAESKRAVGVRIHPLDSPFWIDDLKIFFNECSDKLSHVTIPKVEDPQLLSVALAFIRELRGCTSAKRTNESFGVHLIIESPKGIKNLDQLASQPGIRGLDFGIMDFVSCFGSALPKSAMSSPEQFSNPLVTAAKAELVMTAKSLGLTAAHNVTVNLTPISAARDDALSAKRLGFNRMWSIHPDQVAQILEGFSPTIEERELAKEVLTKAAANQWGPVRVGDVLYDRASYRWLWRALDGE